MMSKRGNNDTLLPSYEQKLQRARTPKEGLSIAKEILSNRLINKLELAGRGGLPNPLRHVGRGARGELWFRNKLLWLRTIPLENDTTFMITHAEAPVYYKGNSGRNSADLLGIWHNVANTKLGVVELKAGRNGDHVLYAIMEGLRNLHLHRKAIKRLREGWDNALDLQNQTGENKFWSNAWGRSNPFNPRLVNSHLVIIGDTHWMQAQRKWKKESEEIIKEIKNSFDYETSIYSLNNAKVLSRPYVLLPLTKWL